MQLSMLFRIYFHFGIDFMTNMFRLICNQTQWEEDFWVSHLLFAQKFTQIDCSLCAQSSLPRFCVVSGPTLDHSIKPYETHSRASHGRAGEVGWIIRWRCSAVLMSSIGYQAFFLCVLCVSILMIETASPRGWTSRVYTESALNREQKKTTAQMNSPGPSLNPPKKIQNLLCYLFNYFPIVPSHQVCFVRCNQYAVERSPPQILAMVQHVWVRVLACC